MALPKLTAYLEKTLKALGLHTEARTSFITYVSSYPLKPKILNLIRYWLPLFNKHQNIAVRFLPQEAYEKAAPLEVEPKPDVVARIFMLFRGVNNDTLESWKGSARRVENPVEDWAKVVGIDPARVLDTSIYRVIEWGGMEVFA